MNMFELLHISSLANISTLICDSVVMLVIYKITIIFNLLIILYDPFFGSEFISNHYICQNILKLCVYIYFCVLFIMDEKDRILLSDFLLLLFPY